MKKFKVLTLLVSGLLFVSCANDGGTSTDDAKGPSGLNSKCFLGHFGKSKAQEALKIVTKKVAKKQLSGARYLEPNDVALLQVQLGAWVAEQKNKNIKEMLLNPKSKQQSFDNLWNGLLDMSAGDSYDLAIKKNCK